MKTCLNIFVSLCFLQISASRAFDSFEMEPQCIQKLNEVETKLIKEGNWKDEHCTVSTANNQSTLSCLRDEGKADGAAGIGAAKETSCLFTCNEETLVVDLKFHVKPKIVFVGVSEAILKRISRDREQGTGTIYNVAHDPISFCGQ